MVLRFAEGRVDRLDALALELVKSNVELIVASPTSGALAAKRATATIPILVPLSLDAVRAGLVSNLSRPGGNLTGLTLMSGDIIAKRLELLRQVLRHLQRLGLLVPGGAPDVVGPFVEVVQSTSGTFGITPVVIESLQANDLERGFESLKKAKVEALYILESQALLAYRDRIGELTEAYGMAAISGTRDYRALLMSYGPDGRELYRRAADLAVRILSGEKPGDLPMEQPTKFELVINMRRAKALGITVPEPLLVRADEVIE